MRLHLRRCPACQQKKAEYKRLDDLLTQAAEVTVPESLLTAWLAGIPEAVPVVKRSVVWEKLKIQRVRWTSISATTVAVALLVALAWVEMRPEPVLARALKATESARTVHTVMKWRNGSMQIESWAEGWQKYRVVTTRASDDGGTQQHIVVHNGDKEWDYLTITNEVHVMEEDLGRPKEDIIGATINPAILLNWALELKEKQHAQIEEYEDRLPDGQVVHVVAAQWESDRRELLFIDLSTNRLVRAESQSLANGQWHIESELETIEYDRPMPQELFTFEPPEGAKVVIHDWWKKRRYEGLAEDTRADWRVVVHSVEVAQDGTVFISLSRINVGNRRINDAVPPRGRLIDEQGRKYAEHNSYGVERECWTLTFSPIEPRKAMEPLPQQFTIELNPYVPSPELPDAWRHRGETMRFENIPAHPLPPYLIAPNVRTDDPDAAQVLQRLKEGRRLAIKTYKQEYGE